MSGNHGQAKRHPAAFLLWGWAMLLVVLLSAAPTGGAPRVRLLGSAFDPTSVSAVLSPKQLRLHASAAALNKRKVHEPVGGPALAIVAASLPERGGFSSSRGPLEDSAERITSALSFTRANGPRAPPLA